MKKKISLVELDDIDFVIESRPWTEEELTEFSALIKKNKEERAKNSNENAS